MVRSICFWVKAAQVCDTGIMLFCYCDVAYHTSPTRADNLQYAVLPLPKWECSSVPHFFIVPP